MKELKRLFTRKTIYRRVCSSLLAMLLVITSVLHPINMVPVYATNNWLQVNYQEQSVDDIEIYVQAESASFEPGETILLDVFVQNNSSKELKDFSLSLRDDKDVFTEKEFILTEDCGEASINEKGTVTNLSFAPGETKELQFEGTLDYDLDILNRREIKFFCGGYDENGEALTATTKFQFTVGLFNELSIDFTDGTELIPDETNTIEITMGFNDIGYYYETEDALVATDSNAEIASDSDAETATDSNAEFASDADAEIATDSDAYEQEEEEYVFDLTDITLDLATAGVKFEKVKLVEASVSEDDATITALVSYKVEENAEAGEYFGTLKANIKSGKKTYVSETAFQFEVAEVTDSTMKKSGLFTAELENFTVNVEVAKGAFDEKVELVVTELAEDSEEFKTAEEAMVASEREFDGMMALDICFINEDGEEVEPNEGYGVQVSIEMKAEVLPEGIDTESLMVHHIAETTTDDVEAEVELVVEDVADTADATDGIVEVKEDAEEAVVAAEFSVESFSTFTITWVSGKVITVKYVTSDGKELNFKGAQTGQVTANSSFDLRKFALTSYVTTDNETYSFVKAVFNNTYEYINVENNAFEWSTENGLLQYYDYAEGEWNDITADSTLDLVYVKVQPGETFKGEDTSGLINVHLKNFEKDTHVGDFTINKSGNLAMNEWTGEQAGVYQGIVSNTLRNGYPVLRSNTGTSLSQYFTGGVNANYLFQIDEKGYYYYDSDLNAAYLNTLNGEFGLYATPHASGNFDSGAEPQFMPYHEMAGVTQTYSSGGRTYQYYPYLKSDGESYVSATPNIDDYTTQNDADYFFGMYVSFDFIMPKDGKVVVKDPSGNIMKDENGEDIIEDMIFEFDGDDDVWVFIDDVLVLDLGGVHLSSGGDINFATGKVTVDRVSNNGYNNGPRVTTLAQLYADASSTTTVDWDGSTYADYSLHTLKFFYLERGAGGSNCKLKFNLQTIPEGTINFEKELGYVNVADASDIEFLFNAYVNYEGTDDDNDYELYTGAYELYSDANDQIPAKIFDSATNGEIKLKDGQMARLINTENTSSSKKISAKSKFYIKEIGATSDKYDVVINDVSVDSSTNNGAIQNNEGVTSNKFIVGSNPYVKFKNNIAAENQFNLRIHKELSAGTDTTTEFKFNLLLGLVDKTVYTGEYYVYDANGTLSTQTPLDATNGAIILKAGQYAEIRGLMGGNTIEVVEDISTLSNLYVPTPTYKIEEKALVVGTRDVNGKAKGTVLEGIALTNALKDANNVMKPINVTVTNHPSTTTATISKHVVGNMADINKLFIFTATLKDGSGAALKFPTPNIDDKYTLSTDGYTATFSLAHNGSITIDGLPVGSKLLVTESADGYTTYYQIGSGAQVKGNPPEVTIATDNSDNILFINEKNVIIDTGISMDTLPYILIMLAVIGGIVFTIIRRRKDDELD